MSNRRRGKGEGSIYQHASGLWIGRVDCGWRDGKRVRRTVYGKTRRACADALTKVLRDRQQGLLSLTPSQSVDTYLREWLQHVASTIRATTLRSYRQVVDDYLRPDLGRLRLDRLTPQQVEAFMQQRQQQGTSASQVRYARNVLRAALGRAVRLGLVSRNVAALATPPRVTRRTIQPLTVDQARTLLQVASQPFKGPKSSTRLSRLGPLVTTALALGLRVGEALGLSWSDVDFDKGHVVIRQQLQWLSKQPPRLVPPKSDAGRRTVVAPPVVLNALRQLRQQQRRDRLRAGGQWQPLAGLDDLVFISRTGQPLHPSTVLRDFQALLTRAGLPRRRLHDLRHSCATLLLAQGVQPRVVASALGHTDVRLTLQTYAHVLLDAQADAAARMQQALTGTAP